VDANGQKSVGPKIPGLGSWLTYGDASKPMKGLDQIPEKDRPPVQATFQFFHLMIAIGFFLIGVSVLGAFYWWRGTLWDKKWFLKLMVWCVLLPQIANQAGWFAAEVGRQPWIVYGMLRTSEALSKAVKSHQVLTSLILFILIYALLFALFVFLLDRKIKHGPDDTTSDEPSDDDLILDKSAQKAMREVNA